MNRLVFTVGPLVLVCTILHVLLVSQHHAQGSGVASFDSARVTAQLEKIAEQQLALEGVLAGWRDGGRLDAVEIASLR